MKIRPAQFACTLAEMAELLPAAEIPALADAAVSYLHAHRESRMIRMLPRLLRESVAKRGTSVLTVITTPMGDLGESRKTLLADIQRLSGKIPELEERADSSLLGGAILAYGDERFDASLRGALDHLRGSIMNAV